jgi:dTDP-4-dehydrorhamnose 3,5-epimerase-like enzyme
MAADRGLGEPLARVFRDERGALTLAELDRLPFPCRRVYVLHDVPVGTRRAGHASRTQHRYVVIARGRAALVLDDGHESKRLELMPGDGIHIPPRTWNELEALDDALVVLVCASGDYNPDDYIRDRAAMPTAATSAALTTST